MMARAIRLTNRISNPSFPLTDTQRIYRYSPSPQVEPRTISRERISVHVYDAFCTR